MSGRGNGESGWPSNGEEVEKPTRKEVAFMMIKIELNFKLHKLSIIIKKDRSADTGTVKATK